MDETEKRYLGLCEKSGSRAFQVGIPSSKCALAKGSAAQKAWRKGWRNAAKAAGFKLKGGIKTPRREAGA